MTVSVVINAYNYAGYLVEAVESALAQSRKPDQIVIVDDGSTDRTLEIAKQQFGTRPDVLIITQRNGGQLAAMVTGFLHATGDIFFMLDADDRYQPDHLAKVMALYEARSDVDFVFTGLQEFGSRTNRQLYHSTDHFFSSGVIRSFNSVEWAGAPTSTISFRRNIVEAMLPVLRDLAPLWRIRADDCLVRGSAATGARKYFLATTSVDYRIHGANNHVARHQGDTPHWQHWFRTLCFMQRLHAHLGIDRSIVRWIHKEFASIPAPLRSDWEAYRTVLSSASNLSWKVRLGCYWRMRQHYAKNGRKDASSAQ